MDIKSFHCPICNNVLLMAEFLSHLHACYSQDCKSKGFTSKCGCTQCVNLNVSNSHLEIDMISKSTSENVFEITKKPKLDAGPSEQSYFDVVPSPVLQQILSYFNEYDNFIVSFVCKRWNSLIVRDQSIDFRWIFGNFCETESLSVLKWLRYQTSLYRVIKIDCHRELISAICGGHFEVTKWLVENGCEISKLHMEYAAYSGNLELFKWVLRNFTFKLDECQHIGAADPTVIKWLVEQGLRPNPREFSKLVKAGNLPMLKWLKNHGCDWDESTCRLLAENGHFEALKWARRIECPWTTDTCSAAARSGHLEILQWARQNNCPWDSATTQNAAKSGNLEILKYAVENQCPIVADIFKHAIYGGGSIEMLNYLKEKNCQKIPEAYISAASKGNIMVLEWLLQEGFPKSGDAYNEAAREGKLEALKWLREHGFTWTSKTLEKAASSTQTFKWLRDNGCPWDDHTLLRVVYANNFKLFKWAVKRGCPIPPDIVEQVADTGNIEMMAFLKQLKKHALDVQACISAASSSKLRMLSWLVKNGAPLTEEVYAAAAEEKATDVMEWLKFHGCPINSVQ